MPFSIGKLRGSVVAASIALLLVVVGFLGVARLKGIHFHLDLPGHLGADISQTADGFTYSQSSQGHTLFTIHASKLVQYKADQAELHDVTITLYGTDGSGRTDKIYGSDFLYDRKQGVARANGAVRIDFAAPQASPQSGYQNGSQASSTTKAQTSAAAGATPTNTIHVTTSGLVFNQATGDATTDQRVDFTLTRASGSAIGASYNSKTGVLVLDREVALTTSPSTPGDEATERGSAAGGPGAGAVVHAGHAQLLRASHQAYLLQADTTYNGEHTTADQATVTFRLDGSAEQIDARGHVHLTTEDGAEVHSSSALIQLNAASQPAEADLDGGVTYYGERGDQIMQGVAVSGTLNFQSEPHPATNDRRPGQGDKPGQELHHAQFRDAVSFVLQQHSFEGDPNGSSTREMHASKVDINFAPGAGGKAEAQQAFGSGAASIKLHDVPAKGAPTSTTVAGDQLVATLAGGHMLKTLDGKGSTRIEDTEPDGTTNTSTGDTLHMTFRPAGGEKGSAKGATGKMAKGSMAKGEARGSERGTVGSLSSARAKADGHPAPPAEAGSGSESGSTALVDTALQTGNVTITQTPAADAKNADGSPQAPVHATAAQAEYREQDQMLHLTGDPHLRNDTLALTADRVDYNRETGDAAALGNVKSTYQQQPAQRSGKPAASAPTLGGEGPVHIVADHAQMTHATSLSIFYGTAAAPARIWQGADAVTAPVLELSRVQQTLEAHGAVGQHAAVVHATFGSKADQAAAHPGPEKNADRTTQTNAAPGRLSSVTLRYADHDRRADLHGMVVAEQPTGVVHSDDAQIFLTPSVAGQPSSVDHMIATGHVVITQPGRRGVGERLVYTAADGRYELTGSPQQPPRVTDAQKGTTTGAALIFKGADDSVEVANRGSGAAGEHPIRTVTDTRVPK